MRQLAKLLPLAIALCLLAYGRGEAQQNPFKNVSTFFAGVSTNSGNAYTIAAPRPSGFSFTNLNQVAFVASAGNTGASTLRVGSAPAEPIEVQTSAGFAPLIGGELISGNVYQAAANTTCTCYVLTGMNGSQKADPFTSATLTAAQFNNGFIAVVRSAGQTITLPAANSLSPSGLMLVQPLGNSVTLAPNAGDAINGGTLGASVPLAAGGTYLVTSKGVVGATAIAETGGGGGGSLVVGTSSITGGTPGGLLYNNGGVLANAPASVSVPSTGIDVLGNGYLIERANDTTTGTTVNHLAKLNAANPSQAVITATTDTAPGIVIGVVEGAAGTSGNAQIVRSGIANTAFDGSTTAGDFVVASTTIAGDVHDTGSTACPTGVGVVGKSVSTFSGTGLWLVDVGNFGCSSSGGGSSIVPSVVSTGSTVTLPTSNATVVIKASASLAADFTCSPGLDITVKDGLGNDATDNITLTPSSGTIDGAATLVMSGSHSGIPPYEARRFQCDASGNAWLVN